MAGGVRKAVDERHYLAKSKGGGMLRREIWIDQANRVVRYNLAYINHLVYSGDNGRVLGYDSARGRHHRHHRGAATAVAAASFARIEALFRSEWTKIMKEVARAQD
jgi:hypothetical protein